MERRGKIVPEKCSEMKISVVIPAHNEQENLIPLMSAIEEMRKSSKLDLEVIIVDDGSTDKTFHIATELSEKYDYLKILKHINRRGLAFALDTGFRNAQGDVYVFYPADLQYHPEDIPKMIAKIEEGYDLVAGWKQGKYQKAFVSGVYNRLARWLFGVKVHDMNSVKAFRKELYDRIFMRADWHRYIIPFAYAFNFKVSEVKVNLYPRNAGESKFTGIGRIFIGLFDMMSVKFLLSLLKKPMLVFGTSGLFTILLGVIFGIVALYYRFVLGIGYRPLLNLVIFLFVIGMSLFTLGFFAEIFGLILQRLNDISSLLRKQDSEKTE